MIVTDKEKSAISILAEQNKKRLLHFDITICDVHPKRPDDEQLERFKKAASEADIIHYEYWKTAEMLRGMYPEFKSKPSILSHYNPYDIYQKDWNDYGIIIVPNKTIFDNLKSNIKPEKLKYIPLAVDLDFFKFNDNYTEEKAVNMVCARIGKEKGIKFVAQVCKELGYKFILVGRPSKPEYLDECYRENPDIDFRQDISDEAVRDSYKESAIHVCNSYDNYESGTLPILESMASGVPVLSREVGHVPDLYEDGNMIVRKGKEYDIKDLKTELKKLMEDFEGRKKMREKAWNTVKGYNSDRRAWQYSRLYYELIYKEPLVSVIIPTFNRAKILFETLISISNQTYPNLEIIIADDNSNDETEEVDLAARISLKIPVKYINTKYDGYGLAKARNMGAIAADGEYLCFLDDRYYADKDLIKNFIARYKPKNWLYGNKGANKKTFVENVSFIKRQDFIDAGMCNEEINQYGGMSQELRERFKRQGFILEYVENAKAEPQYNTKNRWRKKDEIVKMKNLLWRLGL